MAKQSYLEHMKDAWSYAFMSFCASASFFIHGLVPDAMQHTGGNIVKAVQSRIDNKYERLATLDDDELGNEKEQPPAPPASPKTQSSGETTGTSTATLVDGIRYVPIRGNDPYSTYN